MRALEQGLQPSTIDCSRYSHRRRWLRSFNYPATRLDWVDDTKALWTTLYFETRSWKEAKIVARRIVLASESSGQSIAAYCISTYDCWKRGCSAWQVQVQEDYWPLYRDPQYLQQCVVIAQCNVEYAKAARKA